MMADDIPVAHTPPGGYGDEFPPPILAGCTEPLVAGAPDLRGTWRVVSATRGGAPVPEGDPLLGYTERIEQCGNRIVDRGGGTIADGRAGGGEENGVHDVSVVDFTSTWSPPTRTGYSRCDRSAGPASRSPGGLTTMGT